MTTGLATQVRRDLALGWRGRGEALVVLGFFGSSSRCFRWPSAPMPRSCGPSPFR